MINDVMIYGGYLEWREGINRINDEYHRVYELHEGYDDNMSSELTYWEGKIYYYNMKGIKCRNCRIIIVNWRYLPISHDEEYGYNYVDKICCLSKFCHTFKFKNGFREYNYYHRRIRLSPNY